MDPDLQPDVHSGEKESLPHRVQRDLKSRLLTGVLVLLPLTVTYLVLAILFSAMGRLLSPFLKRLPGLPDWAAPVISVLLFLLGVYFVGWLATFLMGRRIIAVFETVIAKIPIVRTIYTTAKQVVESVGVTRKQTFQLAVLVHFPSRGCRTLGFVTGTIADTAGNELLKIFIPTAPNPTSGFLFFAPPDHVEDTNLTVEQAVKMIVSGGIVAPLDLEIQAYSEPESHGR